jgi:hypothetical protein
MDVFLELLTLYAQKTTDAIETDGTVLLNHFRVAELGQLLAIEGYQQAFVLASACARLVDGLASRHPDPQTQATESIRMLRRMIDDGEPERKIEATRTLVEGRLYTSWPLSQQALYNRKKVILEWRDFFVSYTNRDAPATNSQFQLLIRTCFGQTPKGGQNQLNYVARVITRHLRRSEGLTGFFDEDNLQVGENIGNAVDRFCTRAFALVQLIEPLALEREPPQNWCFYEYTKFSQNPEIARLMGDKDRHFFVVAGDNIAAVQPANLAPAFTAWVDRIRDVRYIPLGLERNSSLRTKIKAVATRIVTLRSEIVDAWLQADESQDEGA